MHLRYQSIPIDKSLSITIGNNNNRFFLHRFPSIVTHNECGRIPKDILYGELAVGKRSCGRPKLRYKDVCKRDMKALEIDPENWEDIAADRSSWRCLLHKQLKEGEEKITNEAIEKGLGGKRK